MKNNIYLLLLVAVGWVSCSPPSLYHPMVHSVPALTHQHEFEGSVSGGVARTAGYSGLGVGGVAGFNVNAAYGLLPHLAVLGGGQFMSLGLLPSKGNNFYNAEFGIGYFGVIKPKISIGVNGYFRFGNLNYYAPETISSYPGTDGRLNANLMGYVVEPFIGYQSQHFEILFSPAFGFVNYNHISGNLTVTITHNFLVNTSYTSQNLPNFLSENRYYHLILEPATTIRFGGKALKGQIQLGFPMTDLYHDDFWISLGVSYRIDFFKKSASYY